MSFIPQPLTEALTWHYLCGQARLSISADDFELGELTPCAAEAAVVLDLAGELLDSLAAAGLVADADWQWAASSGSSSAGAQASWRSTEVQLRLSLPWTVLRALGEAPDVPGLQWLPTPAECLLAQWRLAAEEEQALEVGGLLLLEADAAPRLRARSEAMPGERPWQLVARWDQPVALEAVLGWSDRVPALPAHCQLIDATRPELVRARGRLIPWGTGQALRIDAI